MRLRLWLILLAVAFIGGGATLVVRGERQNRADEEVFMLAQEELYSSFDIFAEPDAEKEIDQIKGGSETGLQQNAVAILSIEKLGLKVATVTYEKYSDLRTAVGYMPNSAAPGESGVTFIVGHRTGFGSPFRDLDQLEVGDRISLKNAAGNESEYLIEFIKIKRPSQSIPELKSLTSEMNLLLVTCHPEFSTDFRLIVGARGV